MLAAAGFGSVEVLVVNEIDNDIYGAQLKPLHAIDKLFKRITNSVDPQYRQMKWFIHVDDDTTVNLVAVAHKLLRMKRKLVKI